MTTTAILPPYCLLTVIANYEVCLYFILPHKQHKAKTEFKRSTGGVGSRGSNTTPTIDRPPHIDLNHGLKNYYLVTESALNDTWIILISQCPEHSTRYSHNSSPCNITLWKCRLIYVRRMRSVERVVLNILPDSVSATSRQNRRWSWHFGKSDLPSTKTPQRLMTRTLLATRHSKYCGLVNHMLFNTQTKKNDE